MSFFNQVVDFLPENAELLVLVKPSGNIDPQVEQFLIPGDYASLSRDAYYVSIRLEEPLKIRFSVGFVQIESKMLKSAKKLKF